MLSQNVNIVYNLVTNGAGFALELLFDHAGQRGPLILCPQPNPRFRGLKSPLSKMADATQYVVWSALSPPKAHVDSSSCALHRFLTYYTLREPNSVRENRLVAEAITWPNPLLYAGGPSHLARIHNAVG